MCKIRSLLYHNAINIKNLLIDKYCCCVTVADLGVTSALIIVVSGRQKVNVLHNKPKKIIYTSMPNQITKFYT